MSAAGQPGSERLDAEKIAVLRGWGEGLAASGRDDEIRAAGRALLLLVEEIDHLQRDLWHARAGVSAELPGADTVEREASPKTGTLSQTQLPLTDALTHRIMEHLPQFP